MTLAACPGVTVSSTSSTGLAPLAGRLNLAPALGVAVGAGVAAVELMMAQRSGLESGEVGLRIRLLQRPLKALNIHSGMLEDACLQWVM